MKKLLVILAVAFMLCTAAYADSVSTTTGVSVTVSPMFSVEFYTDDNVLSSTSLSFPTIDSSNIEEAMILPTGRSSGDGKSDTGILCRSNKGINWGLQVSMENATAGFESDNLAVYIPGAVTFRNDGSDPGGIQHSEGWYCLWDVPHTVYAADDASHINNTPFGTLMTFSFAILPQGKATPEGQGAIGSGNVLGANSYSADIKYTMTTAF